MVDLEKDTRRWWFSPRSWLCRSMSAWMASSTEPIWISAILRSFLQGKRGGDTRRREGPSGAGQAQGQRGEGVGLGSLEELEPFHDPAVAGEENLEVILRDGRPAGRERDLSHSVEGQGHSLKTAAERPGKGGVSRSFLGAPEIGYQKMTMSI